MNGSVFSGFLIFAASDHLVVRASGLAARAARATRTWADLAGVQVAGLVMVIWVTSQFPPRNVPAEAVR